MMRVSFTPLLSLPTTATHSPTSTSTMDILRIIDENLHCPITHALMVDPVVLSDGTVYERQAIRSHLAEQRLGRKPPTSPLTNQPLLPMRYQGTYGAEDEDARFYAPICVVKNVCEEVRPHVPSEGQEGVEGLPANIAAIKKSKTNSTQSLAKHNQDTWLEAKRLRDFFLANKAADQPTVSRSEHERLQGAAPDLTPWTIIALGSDMVPLRECMDGKLFDMSMGTFAVWLLIFSKLSEDDTQAFLAGDMTFYRATQKVVASDARDPSSYQERQLRHYKALVNTSQNDLAKKNKRINKCLKMLREVKVRLAEMEGEACLYEAVVAALREDDDA